MFANVAGAVLIFDDRLALSETAFVELIVWSVPEPTRGSAHFFKYRLALIADGICVLRFDNEAGKGDHKHIGSEEVTYRFIDLATLQQDFWKDVEKWMQQQAGQ